MTEPTTEAGKRLWAWAVGDHEAHFPGDSWEAAIDAIEAEARAAVLARVRERVEGMDGADRSPNTHPEVQRGWRQARRAVLAILEEES